MARFIGAHRFDSWIAFSRGPCVVDLGAVSVVILKVVFDGARRGRARQDLTEPGLARLGVAGHDSAGLGMAWHGAASHGTFLEG